VDETKAEITQFGFRFGSMLVERATSLLDGRAVVTIRTDSGRSINIYASRTGRSLRVFENQKELEP